MKCSNSFCGIHNDKCEYLPHDLIIPELMKTQCDFVWWLAFHKFITINGTKLTYNQEGIIIVPVELLHIAESGDLGQLNKSIERYKEYAKTYCASLTNYLQLNGLNKY